MERLDVAVVGGGVAGLTAAAYLARAGLRVAVLERSRELGGRGRSSRLGDVTFNLGPHALYRGGAAEAVLADLGVEVTGGAPALRGVLVRSDGRTVTLPGGPWSLLTSGALPFGAKLDGLGAFAALTRADPRALATTTVDAWLAGAARTAAARELFRTFLRLSTYAADGRQSAGAALAQLGLAATHGVRYLDGGWAALVSALEATARRAGARVETGAVVRTVEHDAGGVRGLHLADGRRVEADAVVLAVMPRAAHQLVQDGPAGARLQGWAEAAVPVEAACLDLALRAPARPGVGIALGLDRPLYFSVHSRAARLGPDGVEVIHAAKYLGPGAPDARADEAELERLLDVARPGWRERLVERRFLPRMVVASALVLAEQGGLPARPGPAVEGAPGVLVAGDWVGGEGLLADASFASAREAARRVLAARGAAAVAA